jgi:serine/threonine-protein kinase
MINQVLAGRYKLLEKVGGGGMADVYRAHDQLLDRAVAVKILHPQFANDDEFIIRFKREAQGAAKVSHPNIVNVYDVGCENNTHYIVMEFVRGETLKEKILEHKRLSVLDALRVAKEIAKALEHAHRNNLVHCDIKPHNILVTERGDIKVTDFGIARAATSTTMTYSDNIVGSVHYFSPEQAKGNPVSDKSDIYSLGIVMYEMLTGKLPFEGDTPISVALKQLQEQPQSVREINPDVAPIVEAIVEKAMAKNPEERFGSISEMIDDLRAAENYVRGTSEKDSDEFATQVIPRLKESDYNKEKGGKAILKTPKKLLFTALAAILAVGFFTGAFLAYGKFWSNSEIAVPNVIGKQMINAKNILEEENLRVKIEETYDENVAAGDVASQYPEAGTVVKEQRIVTIYISKGGEAVKAPDLRGMTLRDAELQLKNMGLKLGRVDERYSEAAKDTVISQNPAYDTQIAKGYTIDIIVSKGEEKKRAAVPDFSGRTVDEIKGSLSEYGLVLGNVTAVEGSGKAGAIISQNPKAGAHLAEETTIDFSVVKEGTQKKSLTMSVAVPEGGEKHTVRFVITDDNGRRTAYENMHRGGETVTKTLEGSGNARVQAYIDNELVKEVND